MRPAAGRRLVAICLIPFPLIALLAGCDVGVGGNNISMARQGDDFSVAPCRDLRIVSILGQYRDFAGGGAWSTFWDSEGRIDLAAGEALSSGEEPEGMESSTRRSPEFTKGTELGVVFGLSDGSTYYNSIVLNEDLADGQWKDRSGADVEAPCADSD